MDEQSNVSKSRHRFGSHTGRLSIKNVCEWIAQELKRHPQVFINPVIVKNSEETLTDFEGCLSAPGKHGEVKRYLRIVLNYKDEKGEEHTKTFYNLEARCIQHELDHLEW